MKKSLPIAASACALALAAGLCACTAGKEQASEASSEPRPSSSIATTANISVTNVSNTSSTTTTEIDAPTEAPTVTENIPVAENAPADGTAAPEPSGTIPLTSADKGAGQTGVEGQQAISIQASASIAELSQLHDRAELDAKLAESKETLKKIYDEACIAVEASTDTSDRKECNLEELTSAWLENSAALDSAYEMAVASLG